MQKKLLTTLYKTQGTPFCQFDRFRRNPDKVMIYFEDEEWTFRSGKTLSCDQSEKCFVSGMLSSFQTGLQTIFSRWDSSEWRREQI